jgi:hypothetical protein
MSQKRLTKEERDEILLRDLLARDPRLGCPVCGSQRFACPTFDAAVRYAGMWCLELERALDRAPPRHLPHDRAVRRGKPALVSTESTDPI